MTCAGVAGPPCLAFVRIACGPQQAGAAKGRPELGRHRQGSATAHPGLARPPRPVKARRPSVTPVSRPVHVGRWSGCDDTMLLMQSRAAHVDDRRPVATGGDKADTCAAADRGCRSIHPTLDRQSSRRVDPAPRRYPWRVARANHHSPVMAKSSSFVWGRKPGTSIRALPCMTLQQPTCQLSGVWAFCEVSIIVDAAQEWLSRMAS